MAKRRLSQQQKQRIDRKQQRMLNNASDDATNTQLARVYARFSKHANIKPLANEHEAELKKCHIRANINSLSVGDIVAFSEQKRGRDVIVAVEPRRSEILRPDGLGQLKAVAANIDQVFIVLAAEPEAHPTLLDRYLLAAENANIQAHIIYNKTDLGMSEQDAELLAIYQSLGYQVHLCSSETGDGLDAISNALTDKTSIFAGQSGVGKSSLINALLPELSIAVGSLSEHVVKGRHTTTRSELFELPQGGFVIDSPGIREFHLTHFERQAVFDGFIEFNNITEACEFRDCRHDQEQNCAYHDFIEQGGIHPSRLQSLEFILSSLEDDLP